MIYLIKKYWALGVGSLVGLGSPAQSILPKEKCEIDISLLYRYVAPSVIDNNSYILVLVNTAVDKHTMAHLVHTTFFRIKSTYPYVKTVWVFDEYLTQKSPHKIRYFFHNILKIPLVDTMNLYVFSDTLYRTLWQELEDRCKYHSTMKIDAFSLHKSKIYDWVHLKTENVTNIIVPIVSKGFMLVKKLALPDSIIFSHLSSNALLPSGDIIRVERSDNKLYFISSKTGKMHVLWEYKYKDALLYFIDYMAWSDSVKNIARNMGLYPPSWNRPAFRLVEVRADDSLLYLTATFEAPCPFETDMIYINVEGEKRTLKTAHTWGYCAYSMFGIAKYNQSNDSIVISKLKWWATPPKELPEPYEKYILSDPESFLFVDGNKILFPTVNYDWKFDRTICYLLPITCKIRYAFKRKYTPSIVAYVIDKSKQGFMNFDTIYGPFRNFRQFLLGSESSAKLVNIDGNYYIFPTLLSPEFDKIGDRRVKNELMVVLNSKRKYVKFKDIILRGNNPQKMPFFLMDVVSYKRQLAAFYNRFGSTYIHFYNKNLQSMGLLPVDSLETFKSCISRANDWADQITCVLGKSIIDLRKRLFYLFVPSEDGNFLHIYKF